MNDPMPGDQRPNVEGALRLRPEEPGDEAFLLHLFRETHGAILAGFEPGLVEMLLRQQHAGQTMTYRTSFPGAHFDIVLRDDAPVGRLVVDDSADTLHIVDIALLPVARGRGFGTALIAAVTRRAAGDGRGVTASVRDGNAASLAMFSRLGFVCVPTDTGDFAVSWRSPA